MERLRVYKSTFIPFPKCIVLIIDIRGLRYQMIIMTYIFGVKQVRGFVKFTFNKLIIQDIPSNIHVTRKEMQP